MIKGLFMVFHGMSAHSGISKKIIYQCRAFNFCKIPTVLCRLDVTRQGTRRRIAGGSVIANFGSGIGGRLTHRLRFDDITEYIRQQRIDFLYLRYDHNANPFTIGWLRRLKKLGVLIAIEIPTYPYDHEYKGQGIGMHIKLAIDRLFRKRLMNYADYIVTFSDDHQIFGRPTLRISNGIDFDYIPLKKQTGKDPQELYLLGVANIHLWHGFDRAITGLANYYRTPRTRTVHFTIVGDGDAKIIDSYRKIISANGLEKYVELVGPRTGSALDEAFERCDIAIASLGRHRSGIEKLRSLKNREYAARGVPFVYSERDEDFDTMPYVLKVQADDSPLDIEELIQFHDSVQMTPAMIRASIEQSLSWNRQIETVIQAFERL